MSENTVKEELRYYTEQLECVANDLKEYQRNIGDARGAYAAQDVILLVAIQGLLRTIADTNPDMLNLGGITKIASDTSAVLASSRHFLNKISSSPLSVLDQLELQYQQPDQQKRYK